MRIEEHVVEATFRSEDVLSRIADKANELLRKGIRFEVDVKRQTLTLVDLHNDIERMRVEVRGTLQDFSILKTETYSSEFFASFKSRVDDIQIFSSEHDVDKMAIILASSRTGMMDCVIVENILYSESSSESRQELGSLKHLNSVARDVLDGYVFDFDNSTSDHLSLIDVANHRRARLTLQAQSNADDIGAAATDVKFEIERDAHYLSSSDINISFEIDVRPSSGLDVCIHALDSVQSEIALFHARLTVESFADLDRLAFVLETETIQEIEI